MKCLFQAQVLKLDVSEKSNAIKSTLFIIPPSCDRKRRRRTLDVAHRSWHQENCNSKDAKDASFPTSSMFSTFTGTYAGLLGSLW